MTSIDARMGAAVTEYSSARKRGDTRGHSAAYAKLHGLRIKAMRRDRRRAALSNAAFAIVELACIAAFIAGVICVGTALS